MSELPADSDIGPLLETSEDQRVSAPVFRVRLVEQRFRELQLRKRQFDEFARELSR
jgi:hypothetical protein